MTKRVVQRLCSKCSKPFLTQRYRLCDDCVKDKNRPWERAVVDRFKEILRKETDAQI